MTVFFFLCVLSFNLHYSSQDHDHIVWSTSRTCSSNKRLAYSMAKVQQMLLKLWKDDLQKGSQITFGFCCNNKINWQMPLYMIHNVRPVHQHLFEVRSGGW